jgi:hypothetical protein
MIPRPTDKAILSDLMAAFPVTAILGARQCGKTTLPRLALDLSSGITSLDLWLELQEWLPSDFLII